MKITKSLYLTWLFHLAISVVFAVVGWAAGNAEFGATAAVFWYGGGEWKDLERELKTGRVKWTQWLDHAGDMAGPVLVLIVVLLL